MESIKNSTIYKLETNLRTMKIPLSRMKVNLVNLKWLSKNLSKFNLNNENYNETFKLINLCLTNKYYCR